ncbi:DNA-processing protein DprA [Kandleria sp.]|uniref:DNA-processing protein DprA n=1 Tax=Kandleria sp. TaxID=2774291 RepID=UPI001B6BAD9A|nr:DNA-processing protein DprA [Kandleria sp.]MBP3275556.1 DNA-processing protein DprA [Kandleria sp.]
MDKMKSILRALSIKYDGDFYRTLEALERKERLDDDEIIIALSLLGDADYSSTTVIDEDYPQRLRMINIPPIVIYHSGRIAEHDSACIAVVGGLDPSPEVMKATEILVSQFIEMGHVIVTTSDKGIAEVVRNTCIAENGRCMVILDGGMDMFDMDSRLTKISEHPGKVETSDEREVFRNRLVIGLSDRVFIINEDSAERTDMMTSLAEEQEKNVFVVESRVVTMTHDGTHMKAS